ncbi:MAG: permease [Actinomycetota bacterium]
MGIDSVVIRRPDTSKSSGPAEPAPRRYLGALVLATAGLILTGRIVGLSEMPAAGTFVLIFTSLVVEALPFVLMGALVSAVIEVYVPQSAFARVANLPLPLQLPAAALGGFAFPVCECGSVPVARRLIVKGMHPSAGLAFMLASPILNPIVLISTAVAYSGRGVAAQMVAGRAGLGLILALAAGWAIGGEGAKELLRPRPDDPPAEHGGSVTPGSRFSAFTGHLAADFFFMGRFVVLGGAIAALMQTAIPQSIVSGVASTPIIGALALMGLAFVLSLCSEADAFVAVSFVQFPLSSQLAFLVFGPVVDAKLALLYGATFRRRFVLRLLAIALPVTLAGSLWFEVVAG